MPATGEAERGPHVMIEREPRMQPSETIALSPARERAVRAELDRLLESAAFRTSKRCREFLRHVVERTLAGANETLKERSIGVELFELPPDFDSSQHTVVRVTANEVRKKLAQQYQAENGASRAVRIELPTGSYCAEFRWEEAAEERPAAVETAGRARPGWLRVAVTAGAAVLLVVAGAVSMRWWSGVKTEGGVAAAAPVAGTAGAGTAAGEVRMIAGLTGSYVDRSGRVWGPDRFFTGGTVVVRPAERVYRTLDPDIYRHARQGDFRYDIPLPPGAYELRLHFAETGLADFISAESSGEGQRLFRVAANGRVLLDFFDVVADAAGPNIATQRVFRNVSPAEDGFLRLSFAPMRGTAMVSGIELLPAAGAKARALRVRAGWTSAWQDSAGQHWQGDSYFLGGNAFVRTTNPARASDSVSPDAALYASERWGHFSYALPVAEGRYRVTLKFCEGHYGRKNTGVGGAGSRVFDVYANGVALLRNFDIFKEAGGEGRPIDRAFGGLRPTAQGKIVLTFVPVVGMACVNGMEVVEE
ncbi:MAG: malectin domain-containing carbohydrate-binding protein [Bryobacteraceae bacterium]|nr:malectin domain-containing carbohydrate-binding protein [Bryobacteraceae bacterium]